MAQSPAPCPETGVARHAAAVSCRPATLAAGGGRAGGESARLQADLAPDDRGPSPRRRPGAGQLFLARGGTRTLAAMLFLRHGRVATYQVGWSSDDGRKASAGNLLMWRAMLGFAGDGPRTDRPGPCRRGRLARAGAVQAGHRGAAQAPRRHLDKQRRPARLPGAGLSGRAGRRSFDQPATARNRRARAGGTALISRPVNTCSVPRSRSMTAWSLTHPPSAGMCATAAASLPAPA